MYIYIRYNTRQHHPVEPATLYQQCQYSRVPLLVGTGAPVVAATTSIRFYLNASQSECIQSCFGLGQNLSKPLFDSGDVVNIVHAVHLHVSSLHQVSCGQSFLDRFGAAGDLFRSHAGDAKDSVDGAQAFAARWAL